MIDKSLNRIFGLDLLRCFAVFEVVIGHSRLLINQYSNSPFIHLPDGVDLFFVLSGYLIGTILIKAAEEKQKFDFKSALNFLKRRWFRTLPNYYLFLIINIILIYYGFGDGVLDNYLATFFVFLQTFNKPHDSFFYESWSLSVEEWFYFLFPLALLLINRVAKNKISIKKNIFFAILFFLILPLIYRIYHINEVLDFNSYYRKLVLTRLDTIAFGFVGAYIHWYYVGFWQKNKNIFFLLGFTMLISLNLGCIPFSLFYKSFYYSFIGVSILLMLPKLESLKNENIPLKPVRFISKISYSMYLVHMPLLQIICKIFIVTNKTESIIIYVIFWLTTLLLSYVVYNFYELPIMNLRDKTRKQLAKEKSDL
jgi:peptidoglycan/LPS O-acetylase OafA/YrhL